jgi:hypothetical protein
MRFWLCKNSLYFVKIRLLFPARQNIHPYDPVGSDQKQNRRDLGVGRRREDPHAFDFFAGIYRGAVLDGEFFRGVVYVYLYFRIHISVLVEGDPIRIRRFGQDHNGRDSGDNDYRGNDQDNEQFTLFFVKFFHVARLSFSSVSLLIIRLFAENEQYERI